MGMEISMDDCFMASSGSKQVLLRENSDFSS